MLPDKSVLTLARGMRIMENACVANDGSGIANWECQAAKIASDPDASPAPKSALAEALKQDPVDAVNKAESVYQILLQRALAQPNGEWKGINRSTSCWVCNSHNTRLVVAPGYGVVHECLDCRDRFPHDGPIQWVV